MNKSYTAVLVDDMPDALKVLESDLLRYCPQIKIVGTANSVISAAKILNSRQPDILFLDIMLGDGTGFDLLEIVPNLNSKIIFITAFDEYAVKAFRFSAIDYLLKPLNSEHLIKAVEKSLDQLPTSTESLEILKQTINHPNDLPQRISLHSQDKISVVPIKNIIRCESDGNNTVFFLQGGLKIYVTKTLKSFERLFQHHSFARVHQSHLVQLSYIHEYIRKDGGFLRMTNGDDVPVAIRKKSEVIDMLSNLGL